ncbi:hypothetical protein PAXRUDRAFT_178418, partial [Paxillus rubicundulus Ve08.2h10]
APSKAPAIRSQHPSHAASSKQGTPVNTQPPTNPQDRPNVASSSTGIMLRIPPLQATLATMIRMESAPKTSAIKAPVNMGLIPGTVYSLGRNPLVSHEEHCAALQRLETMEVENHELRGLIVRALDHIEVLEQGMALLVAATIYSGLQMSSVANAPIPAPVSPAISIPPVEVLAEMKSASDNVGSGSSK